MEPQANGTTQNAALQPPKPAAAIVPINQPALPAVHVGFETDRGFEALQRVGRMFSKSAIVPDAFKGEDNLGSCCVAIELANRLGISPLAVMQHLYLVHGRPAWSAQFYVSSFNTCGRFAALKYRFAGAKNSDAWSCVAYSTELSTGEKVEGTEITIKMAKEEGWYTKNGSKWKTMPEQMLRYRAAAFLVRSVAPELTMGILTREEAEDAPEVRDITPPAPVRLPPQRVAQIAEPPPPDESPSPSAEAAPETPADSSPSEPPSHDPATGETRTSEMSAGLESDLTDARDAKTIGSIRSRIEQAFRANLLTKGDVIHLFRKALLACGGDRTMLNEVSVLVGSLKKAPGSFTEEEVKVIADEYSKTKK